MCSVFYTIVLKVPAIKFKDSVHITKDPNALSPYSMNSLLNDQLLSILPITELKIPKGKYKNRSRKID
ncbi:hypothetical protein HK099_002945 [Clydaea vesicula]|uniref:Uncharacterized protein n=1 Tax=Clydaea vesicula TaxID=447962 RepID=A0AAD5U6N5_9FUNG|nr:hypothetical protein HK099_002945 [Clydaea vesicula]